jgi:PKD repeat protein
VAQIGGAQAGQLTVSAGGPYTGQVGIPVSFTGQIISGFLPAGVTAQYIWNFGNGQTGAGQSTSHAYTSAGTFTVTLTVTTSAGQTGSATTTVTVGGGTVGAAGTEQVPLFPNCNNVAATWPDGTPITVVTAAVSPPGGLVTIWVFINTQQRYAGYSAAPNAPNDLTAVNRGQPMFICMNVNGTLTRPVI